MSKLNQESNLPTVEAVHGGRSGVIHREETVDLLRIGRVEGERVVLSRRLSGEEWMRQRETGELPEGVEVERAIEH